jgi:ABC-type bacteriocin/lantibiotic exporter with double-glycine peptidase domain
VRLTLIAALAGALAAESGGIWLDVPFVRQQKNGCGPAAIAMVFDYWRLQGLTSSSLPDDAGVERDLASTSEEGLRARDMQAYMEAHGFRAFAVAATWDDLASHLAKGRPMIVALNGGRGRMLHYVVVAGLDTERGLVFVNDPAQRKLLTIDRRTFERDWHASGRWALLALPPQ